MDTCKSCGEDAVIDDDVDGVLKRICTECGNIAEDISKPVSIEICC